jgi:hypothetical protein
MPRTAAEAQSVWWLTNSTRGSGDDQLRRFAKWRDAAPPMPTKGQRWAESLCGGSVRECDMRSAAGVAAARAAVAAQVPIVMRGASSVLAPEVCAELSSLERLDALLAELDVTVLRAPREAKGRFTYYREVEARGAEAAMVPPPVNERVLMKWEELRALVVGGGASEGAPAKSGANKGGALRKGAKGGRSATARDGSHYYMQLAIAARQGGLHGGDPRNGMATRVSPRLLAQLQSGMRAGPLHEVTAPLGDWSVSNLYVGPPDTLAPCHWDALDNLFVQLHGHKDLLLFPPHQAGLAPFPVDHPYSSRAQTSLEAADEHAHAQLAGAGALAALAPGDALFLPSHWWHHVHARHANDVSISLNMWFDGSRLPLQDLQRGGALPTPPTAAMDAHMAREAETLIAAVAPRCTERARCFAALRAALAGEAAPDGVGAEAAARVHFVAQMLAGVYGQEGARSFARCHLDPQRWTTLRRVCFLDV